MFLAEIYNDETNNSDVIFNERENPNSFENEIDNIAGKNFVNLIFFIYFTNLLIFFIDTNVQIVSITNDCNNLNQNINGESNKNQYIIENSDIKILDSSSCNFQILNLFQNPDVQYVVNANDIPQFLPNTVITNGATVVNVQPIERLESRIIKTEVVQKTQPQNVSKKGKMSSEDIEQNVAKKVKTIMESIVNSSENIKKESSAKPVSSDASDKKSEPIKCEMCGNMYKDHASLRKHKYIVHEAQASFKCDFCGKSFKTSYR